MSSWDVGGQPSRDAAARMEKLGRWLMAAYVLAIFGVLALGASAGG